MSEIDMARRFGGIARLYGDAALARFQTAHVAVIGIGGVGSWAVEALARSAIGTLTLIDLDHVAESNINRQIHALDTTLGQAKVEAMAERIAAINPIAQVHQIDDFIDLDNLAGHIDQRFDFVVDAIDSVKVKAALIAHCRRNKIKLITCGGAGGQIDPTQIEVADLARTTQDPLLAKTRQMLRRDYGFNKDVKKKFEVPAVFSTEPLRYPEASACDVDDAGAAGPAGLNCAGFGSAVGVTASFGLVAASYVLNKLAGR
ncbi:tRNA cyclic N6-threonylcarbamoyladenosine(37) synthase TcdA [Chitinivorax sp. PXF-14]|uniref:tRNA cyclic N6-threonylcarbamoyladenosine(37) synthase TcdA n=1 Tax=Chitinivorax sp. PXF-14 TaxID=3230488 RepID=UPI0034658635